MNGERGGRVGELVPQAGERPGAATVAIVCMGCGAGIRLASSSTEYVCPGCGSRFYLRKCPACSKTVHVGTGLAGKNVKCLGCGRQHRWAKWQQGQMTAQAVAAQISLSQEQVEDPDRRIVGGSAVAATGFPPIAPGIACKLEFAAERILVLTLIANRGYQPTAIVPYDEAKTLRIAGRGAITSTRGGGWIGGGFGVAGILEGALLASALNTATRRTNTTIETLVHFNAGRRELLLVNRQVTPDVLQVRLAPVFARLDAAREAATAQQAPLPASDDRLAKLQQLGELRASGVLDEQEFLAEKRRLLGT